MHVASTEYNLVTAAAEHSLHVRIDSGNEKPPFYTALWSNDVSVVLLTPNAAQRKSLSELSKRS